MRAAFSCLYVIPTVIPSYETALPPPPLDTRTPKTLDFFKNKGDISIFGHGVRFRKFNSPFHTLGGHKIGSIGCNLHRSKSRRMKVYHWQPI